MTTETDATNEPQPEAAVAIHKHAAWLVRDGLLTPHGAIEVQRALHRALTESAKDRLAVIALVDALLHALDKKLLSEEVFALDEAQGVARFHHARVFLELVAVRLISASTGARLRSLLSSVEVWCPDAGVRGVHRRFTFATNVRHRGFELDLAKGRDFLKRNEAVPSR